MFVVLFYQVFIFNNWVFFVLGNMIYLIAYHHSFAATFCAGSYNNISLFTITILGLAVGMAVEVPYAEKPELSVSNVLSLMCATDQNVTYVVSRPSAISHPLLPK